MAGRAGNLLFVLLELIVHLRRNHAIATAAGARDRGRDSDTCARSAYPIVPAEERGADSVDRVLAGAHELIEIGVDLLFARGDLGFLARTLVFDFLDFGFDAFAGFFRAIEIELRLRLLGIEGFADFFKLIHLALGGLQVARVGHGSRDLGFGALDAVLVELLRCRGLAMRLFHLAHRGFFCLDRQGELTGRVVEGFEFEREILFLGLELVDFEIKFLNLNECEKLFF